MPKTKNILTNLLNPEPTKNPDKAVEAAQKKAKKIIIKATLKAKDIIESADALDEMLQNELNEALSFAIQRQTETFGEKVRESATQILAKFEELLEIQLKASQTLVLSSFENSLSKVNESLKAYELEKRKQIEKITKMQALELAREVLGKAIPEETQEKLIGDAVLIAKKEGLFE